MKSQGQVGGHHCPKLMVGKRDLIIGIRIQARWMQTHAIPALRSTSAQQLATLFKWSTDQGGFNFRGRQDRFKIFIAWQIWAWRPGHDNLVPSIFL